MNVYEAKTHLSKLLERVERGEEITIARHGRPIARLVPLARPRGKRRPGARPGTVVVADGVDLVGSDPDVVTLLLGSPAEEPAP